jgi:hypothetical protein
VQFFRLKKFFFTFRLDVVFDSALALTLVSVSWFECRLFAWLEVDSRHGVCSRGRRHYTQAHPRYSYQQDITLLAGDLDLVKHSTNHIKNIHVCTLIYFFKANFKNYQIVTDIIRILAV